MKKLLLLTCMLLLAGSISAQAPKFGVGGFGGLNIPVIQDDQASGTVFGIRAKFMALPFLSLEPNVTFGKWGKPDVIDGVDLGIDGSKVNSYGVDAALGSKPGLGVKPFFVAGAGIYKIKNDDTNFDESKLGFNFGLGLGLGLTPKFDIDVRGNFIMATQEGGGSKKAIYITAGLSYFLGGGM